MCVDAFISSWVARFGVPGTVTMDRGTQFTSALWSSTCTSLVTGTPLVLPGQLLHVPDPPRVEVPPPPTRPLSYAAAANTPPAHLARAEHVYVRVGGQQKPLAAPYAGPYLVVFKGAKTFTIQVGQRQEIVSVDRLKPHTGLGPVSPTEAASHVCPPKMPAALSIQPASS